MHRRPQPDFIGPVDFPKPMREEVELRLGHRSTSSWSESSAERQAAPGRTGSCGGAGPPAGASAQVADGCLVRKTGSPATLASAAVQSGNTGDRVRVAQLVKEVRLLGW